MITRLFFRLAAAIALLSPGSTFAQADPASEPAVLAVGKVLPAVVNILVFEAGMYRPSGSIAISSLPLSSATTRPKRGPCPAACNRASTRA